MTGSTFLNLFVKSPFKRLEAHMFVVQKCVGALDSVFDACQSEDWCSAKNHYAYIAKQESIADTMKHKIKLKIHHDLYLPVSRSELLTLLDMQDQLANKAEDIALLMVARKMKFPEDIRAKIGPLLAEATVVAQRSQRVSAELADLVETGFQGLSMKLSKELINDLCVLEGRVDQKQVEARKVLYEVESSYPALDVVFWYDCINQIGSLADWSRRLGTQLMILSSR